MEIEKLICINLLSDDAFEDAYRKTHLYTCMHEVISLYIPNALQK